MTDQEKIKYAVETFEFYNNGFKNLSGVDAIVRNLKVTKKTVRADIILKWYEDGITKRHNAVEYPLDFILEKVKAHEKAGTYEELQKNYK